MKHMIEKILRLDTRPELYEPGTAPAFWNDPHISKGMLEAHLNPDLESATRKHGFVEKSAAWIASLFPPQRYPDLLDLGCGPGIYAEQFHRLGYRVAGLDLSERSVEYARSSARQKGLDIGYTAGSYLDMDLRESCDLAVLIYCDFGVLSPEDRKRLLRNVHRALKPGGALILDAFTAEDRAGIPESHTWSCRETGFWSDRPHLCLESFFRYDAAGTFLHRAIVATDDGVVSYNLWEHVFTPEELTLELREAGFGQISLHGDVAGAPLAAGSRTLCAAAFK